MTFTREQRDLFESLRRKHRICFQGSVAAADWPPNHRRSFATIQSLGNLKYDEYSAKPPNEIENEPWKMQAKELAAQLTEQAARCCRRNEASWRFACEPLIFARLSADVACPNCRGRVWRSAIEVSWKGDGRRAAALKERQESRRPCRCNRSTRHIDSQEAVGLNRIFTHREQESILLHAALAKELGKEEQQPDRIYGLRQTRNFEEALYARAHSEPGQSDNLVADLITTSPLSTDGDPLLFPFLVLEAKSGKAADDWHSIKLQTAFPIRACLDVQHDLQTATSRGYRWQNGPLVWFFMNKGEDWQLCAAYMQTKASPKDLKDASDYHILDLWNGSIVTRDGALQLLLIVDFIFDWARDDYRQDILTGIRTLSRGSEGATSIFPDSDLMSTRELVTSEVINLAARESSERDEQIESAFHTFDSPKGFVRHAALIESKFRALFITRDNVHTLLQSTDSRVVQLLARRVLGEISNNVFSVDIGTLDALEEQWTGTARYSRSLNLMNTRFLTAFTLGTYFTPTWGQVRELSVVAVAEDAFESLVEGSKLCPGRGKAQKPTSIPLDRAVLATFISHLQDIRPDHSLLATIKRMLLRISHSSSTGELELAESDGALRSIVHFVYSSLKRGVLEPSESFLRVSSRHERLRHNAYSESPYPIFENLRLSAWDVVLIYGRGPSSGVQRSRLSSICAYFVGDQAEAPAISDLAAAIKNTFENNDVYHTTRDNGKDNIRSVRHSWRAPWNLENVYGIYTTDTGFIKWLEHLGSAPPERQGAPRDPAGSGKYLLSRRIYPWHDPRLIGLRSDFEIFLFYKLMVSELLYWRTVARERNEENIRCCRACAAADFLMNDHDSDICIECWEEIQNPTFPRWVADALMGKEKIRWIQVEEQLYSKADRLSNKPGWWLDSLSTSYGKDFPPHEQWYKSLSEYSELDDDFTDVCELREQALRYHSYQFRKKHPRFSESTSGKTRKRSGSHLDSDSE